MKRLLIFLLFATSAAARPHDYTLHAPKIPPFHAIKVTPVIFAQTNTFCAANLACSVTGAWTFNGPIIGSGASLQGTFGGGPSFTIANSPAGATEVGNVVTISTSPTICTLVANQSVVIAGVGVAGYNTNNGVNGFTVITGCGGGTTFTYFNPTASLAASGGGTATASPIFSQGLTHTGPETIIGTLTTTNENNVYWAGPGATPTIDQAVALCGANPCVVEIAPTYTGPESANLFTTSTTYKVYNGPNNVTILDRRAIDTGSGAPAGTPLYPVTYGGRSDGELSRMSLNYFANSPNDSTTTAPSWNWFQGTLPTNNGSQQALSAVTVLHDTVTIGASASPFVGADAELWADATASDAPVPIATAINGGVVINRANATQNVTTARAFHASGCGFSGVSPTATFTDCYGFDGDGSAAPLQRSFAFHSNGNWMTENNTGWYAGDTGTVYTINSITSAGQIETVTTSIVCTLTTGQHVIIASVAPTTAYNGNFVVRSPGCNGGSTFTYFNAGTNNLTASGVSGTATGTTPRILINYTTGNLIDQRPLADTVGWSWLTQAGSTLMTVTSTAEQVAHDLSPTSDGAAFLGGSNSWAGLYLKENGGPSGLAGKDVCQGNSTTHTLQCSYNAGTAFTIPQTIGSGTAAMTTALIASVACGTTVTVAAVGVLTTDTIDIAHNVAVTNANGGLLTLNAWPTAGNVNFNYCNPTAAGQTPTAMTINWSVRRP